MTVQREMLNGARRVTGLILLLILTPAVTLDLAFGASKPETPFRFENISSLDDMRTYLKETFPLGSKRGVLRSTFVDNGRATLIIHPSRPGVEKYIYDINLCRYYIWRWNISADYDAAGKLLQSYTNGDPTFGGGNQKQDGRVLGQSAHASILKSKRLRPEANLGEKELVFTVVDADGDPRTTNDQVLFGGGPTRVSIAAGAKLYVYSDVDPWRSIFDSDSVKFIAPYPGDCTSDIEAARKTSMPNTSK
jgi:hypothetical protein